MKLLQILYDTYKEEYELNIKEGLTKTHQIDQSMQIIDRALKAKGLEPGDRKSGLLLPRKLNSNQYYINKNENVFHIIVPTKDLSIDFNDVVKLANTLGWFPSTLMVTGGYYGNWDPSKIPGPDVDSGVTVRFEPKYDEQSGFNVPKYLYHATEEKNYEKIKKAGLSPRSRSKMSYHPDRVYLAKDLDSAKYLISRFNELKPSPEKYVILRIDTESVPGGYLKLYKDPNYSERGFYTMNNIPPYAIERVKY